MQKNNILKAILNLKTRKEQGLVKLPKSIKIVEVGPRDGLQNEKKVLSAEFKINMINKLLKSGLYHVEAGSFVSPKWVPQMANSDEVIQNVIIPESLKHKVILSALTPNLKGLENALKTKINEIAVFTAASESFVQKNINCSIDESFSKFLPIIEQAKEHNIKVRGYVSCVMGCPYEGDINPEKVVEVTSRLLEMGCYEVSLGDTIGVGTTEKTLQLMNSFEGKIDYKHLAAHFHDTFGNAILNILICLEKGISVFDSSVGGIGGCPYAKKSVGNVCTENLVEMANLLDIYTGVDLDYLKTISQEFRDFLDRKVDYLI